MGLECIAAIDIFGGAVVRLRQGRFDQVTVYGQDPVAFAARFRAAGARTVHVVNLDAARGQGSWAGIPIRALAELGLAVEAAGGIRRAEDARRCLDEGALRVVVGSAATDPRRLAEILAVAGPERLAVALDVRREHLVVNGWEEAAAWTLAERLEALAAEGVERVQYTQVERDGTLAGPDLEALALLRTGPFHVTVAGGIRDREDLLQLAAAGADAAIVGRALYEGGLTPEEAFGAC
jgi:phosphoribosylformimino-5-aminoimidazole carboxamide ribotide isomerase